jgi:hypothetical protein
LQQLQKQIRLKMQQQQQSHSNCNSRTGENSSCIIRAGYNRISNVAEPETTQSRQIAAA